MWFYSSAWKRLRRTLLVWHTLVLRANWVFLQSRTGGNHNEAGYRVNQEFEVWVSLIESPLAKFQLRCWKASEFEYLELNGQKPKLQCVQTNDKMDLLNKYELSLPYHRYESSLDCLSVTSGEVVANWQKHIFQWLWVLAYYWVLYWQFLVSWRRMMYEVVRLSCGTLKWSSALAEKLGVSSVLLGIGCYLKVDICQENTSQPKVSFSIEPVQAKTCSPSCGFDRPQPVRSSSFSCFRWYSPFASIVEIELYDKS